MNLNLQTIINICYFAAAVLFIIGLKRMSSPATARGGIVWAGVGMLIAVVATLFTPGLHNLPWMISALVIATGLAWYSGKRVPMTDMPQMVALYNGMGGGSAAAIGAVTLIAIANGTELHPTTATSMALALIGSLIGGISFSGSMIAFAKLQGWMDRRFTFPGQQIFNLAVFAVTVALGVWLFISSDNLSITVIVAFFVLAFLVGLLMTLPIGGADMPVVISLYNAFTGLAVAFEGYVLQNEAMIIAGMVVGAAGTLLTQLMAKAMNRSIANVLFGSFGAGASGEAQSIEGAMKAIDPSDAAVMIAYAERVVIVPGYGLAVAQAQHKIWELTQQLLKRGVKVRFAIHPVAGRMPGHMNVLLAEAGVPYDLIADMDDINPEFALTDVSIVIGANDVVNPVAKTDPASPIYGMPILDVDQSKNVIIVKRGKGTGFAGIENALFYKDNAKMLYGDGQDVASKLIAELKALD